MPKEKPPKVINGFRVPEWWECQWKRDSCNKPSCRLCGPILRDREERIRRGEDPDSMEAVLDYVSKSFAEAMVLLRKKAEEIGIDLDNLPDDDYDRTPTPEKFPLYRSVSRFYDEFVEIQKSAGRDDELWPASEAAVNVCWYASMLRAKTYRQLCTFWDVKRGREEGCSIDYIYTSYVIRQCEEYIHEGLSELAALKTAYKAELLRLLGKFRKLQRQLMRIKDK